MERRMSVSILGGERNLEPGEFSLQFGFGRLCNERKSTPVLAALLELTIAKAGLAILDEGDPASSDVDRFSRHKDQVKYPPLPSDR